MPANKVVSYEEWLKGMPRTAETHGGHDANAYLGHNNIQRIVRYTDLAPERFHGLWDE